jgi:hypothetical protein
MRPRSPTLEGFRAILRRPSFGLAEIAWRWSFGGAAGLLFTLALFEYLKTLPLTRGDLVLLSTKRPFLISQAMVHIFRGSGFRLVEAVLVLSLALGAAWIGVASLARVATIRALLLHFHEGDACLPPDRPQFRLRALFELNFLRVCVTIAAVIGCLAAIFLGRAMTSASAPAPGRAVLVVLTVALLVWLAWSIVSWFLSLSVVFVVVEGKDSFGAVSAAVDLCATRPGSIIAANTWFGLAHFVAFVVATSVVAFPLGLAGALPASMVLGGVLLITLLYFAVVDFLHAGRLAAYVAMLELPDPRSVRGITPLPPNTQPSALIPRREGVDPAELILSDLSAPVET